MLEQYPFLSYIKYTHSDYIGVVQNYDTDLISMYAFNKLRTEDHKIKFLEQADVWWWESNRQVPISIFLRIPIEPFRYAIKTFNSKDVRIVLGPVVNLMNLTVKRVKRKSVQLVRKVN